MMTFILPVIIIIICFIIIAFKISKLAKRARETELRSTGFRNMQASTSPQRKSLVRKSLERAKRLSQLVTIFITITFLICWGPYYLVAIVQWFNQQRLSELAQQCMLMTLYLNPCCHPLIIILLLKDIRRNLDFSMPSCCHVNNYIGHRKCSGTSSRSISPDENKIVLQDLKAGHSRTTHV